MNLYNQFLNDLLILRGEIFGEEEFTVELFERNLVKFILRIISLSNDQFT